MRVKEILKKLSNRRKIVIEINERILCHLVLLTITNDIFKSSDRLVCEKKDASLYVANLNKFTNILVVWTSDINIVIIT